MPRRRSAPPTAATRERLLAAAGRIFAQRGYRMATVAMICRAAGANIAAVNYHFGGKAELYANAWRYAFDRMLAHHPPDGGVPAGAPAAARLRGRISAFMHRLADAGNHGAAIIHREMVTPTGLLTRQLRQALRPLRTGMRDLVAELLGPAATPGRIRHCAASVRAQCLGPWHRRRQTITGSPLPVEPVTGLETLIDHAVHFCLGGIASVRAAAGSPGRRRGRSPS